MEDGKVDIDMCAVLYSVYFKERSKQCNGWVTMGDNICWMFILLVLKVCHTVHTNIVG